MQQVSYFLADICVYRSSYALYFSNYICTFLFKLSGYYPVCTGSCLLTTCFKTASGMNNCATAYIGKSTPMHFQSVVLEKDWFFELKRQKTQKFLSRYFQKTPANLDLTPKSNFGKCFSKSALRRQLKTFSFINEPCQFISHNLNFGKEFFKTVRVAVAF